jgi:hypothetical protein
MILIYAFNNLSQDHKAEYVWDNGKHLVNLKGEECSFSLYRIPDFFVEFELQDNKIINIRSFKQGQILDKYLDRIDLKKLIHE